MNYDSGLSFGSERRFSSTYLLGGKLSNGFTVTPKYYGDRRVIEIAVATLGSVTIATLLKEVGRAAGAGSAVAAG